MVCEINYGVMKFSELLFGQIAARLIITFYYISERTVKISRENIDQLPVSSRFRAHFSLLLLSLTRNRNCHARFHEKWINYHFRDKHLPLQL